MISILFPILLCLFSVHVTDCTEIQEETTYTYNYDNNFGDIFHLGNIDGFNLYKYTDLDTITAYNDSHIGGAFTMEGTSYSTTNFFDGYIVDISTTFYCTKYIDYLRISVYYADGEHDTNELCINDIYWVNNRISTWIPPTRSSHSEVSIHCRSVEECT